MKSLNFLGVLAVFALLLFTAAIAGRNTEKKSIKSTKQSGFVVLELFTSEGCSSCPPADELLAKIQQQAKNKPIYILAYHVDYWNRLGWKDVFSKPEFTERQYQYSKNLNAQVYTPQLVVNGVTEMIGSDENAVQKAIKENLTGTPKITLNLKGEQKSNKLLINYQIKGDPKNSELAVAIVKKQAITQVKNGENAGHTLSHVQIVERIVTFNINSGKEISLVLPKTFNIRDWEVLGLLQNTETGEINAAAIVALSN